MSTSRKIYYKDYRDRLTIPYIRDMLKKQGFKKHEITDKTLIIKKKMMVLHRLMICELKKINDI